MTGSIVIILIIVLQIYGYDNHGDDDGAEGCDSDAAADDYVY